MNRREAIELALREIGHIERLVILEALAEHPHSPVEVAKRDSRAVGRVSYHFRTLAERKLIRKTREQRVRGAVQSFYSITPKGKRLLEKLDEGPDAGS